MQDNNETQNNETTAEPVVTTTNTNKETTPTPTVETRVKAEPTKSKKTSTEEAKVDFEVWYSIRSKNIPANHHKEILKADFKGRKVPSSATMAEFDSALRKYGVKLK